MCHENFQTTPPPPARRRIVISYQPSWVVSILRLIVTGLAVLSGVRPYHLALHGDRQAIWMLMLVASFVTILALWAAADLWQRYRSRTR